MVAILNRNLNQSFSNSISKTLTLVTTNSTFIIVIQFLTPSHTEENTFLLHTATASGEEFNSIEQEEELIAEVKKRVTASTKKRLPEVECYWKKRYIKG